MALRRGIKDMKTDLSRKMKRDELLNSAEALKELKKSYQGLGPVPDRAAVILALDAGISALRKRANG